MTKKDYKAIAEILKSVQHIHEESKLSFIIVRLIKLFKNDNPRFDEEKFKNAIWDLD